jgi:hypothetical protein
MVEGRGRGMKPFRYENVWQTHANYDQLVLANWQKGWDANGLAGVAQALNALQSSLSQWGAKEFGCLARKIQKLRQKLDCLRSRSTGHGPSDEERAITKQLRETTSRRNLDASMILSAMVM